MDRLLDEGVVLRETLSFSEFEGSTSGLVAVTLAGRLVCKGGVAIRVDKKLVLKLEIWRLVSPMQAGRSPLP